ncbi:YadA-like family protein [Streptomyces chumphonensis]|uniref:YadA-like family protein n=1 Tax=Streptomyces chumphonensis TaxID=1214925 RepID=A0A927IFG6_9ACTN|nr:YadA-like family protein [Streptomyces chumphonensis]
MAAIARGHDQDAPAVGGEHTSADRVGVHGGGNCSRRRGVAWRVGVGVVGSSAEHA